MKKRELKRNNIYVYIMWEKRQGKGRGKKKRGYGRSVWVKREKKVVACQIDSKIIG